MSTLKTATSAGQASAANSLQVGRLNHRVPWILLALCILAAAGGSAFIAISSGTRFNAVTSAFIAAALYLVAIFFIALIVEGLRRAVNRLVTGLVCCSFLVAITPLISVGAEVIRLGSARFDSEFLTYSMKNIIGEGGGAFHAMIGTLLITLTATLISVPLGLFTSIYLVEYGRGKIAKTVTFLVDVMIGIPSIVAGLFAFAVFAIFLGPGVRMGIAGALALTVLMTPVVIRSSEEMLRLVPNELREASYALGVPKWLTVLKIVLPTAVAGITTGVMLAIARVIGETAPLLITAGFTASLNTNLFEGRMQSLPVFVYTQYANQGNPAAAFVDRAWAAALLLIIIVMLLNLCARLIAKAFAPKHSK